jgi:metal-responsive CopG/Arc/MetJ family transcriptional regulator
MLECGFPAGNLGVKVRSQSSIFSGSGYTKSMKTAVSIPDDVFQGAERLARHSRKSRSELYADAVREYIARHSTVEVTEAYDALVGDLGPPHHSDQASFAMQAAKRTLSRSEW